MSYWKNCPSCGHPFTVGLQRQLYDSKCCPSCEAAEAAKGRASSPRPEDVAAGIAVLVAVVAFLYKNRERITLRIIAIATITGTAIHSSFAWTRSNASDLYKNRSRFVQNLKSIMARISNGTQKLSQPVTSALLGFYRKRKRLAENLTGKITAPEWYVRRGEIQRGPLTGQELARLIERGIIVASDLVRTADDTEWRLAGDIKAMCGTEATENPVALPASLTSKSFSKETTDFPTSEKWYYSKANQQFGPITAAELKVLAFSEQLSPSDFIWNEQWPDWKAAGTIKGFFPEPQTKSSPPPIPPVSPSTKAEEPTEESQSTTSTVDDIVEHWFYQKDDQQVGPLLLRDLADLAAKGAIAPADLVRRNDSKWIAVDSLLGSSPDQTQLKNEDEWFYLYATGWIGPRPFSELRRLAASAFFSQSTLIRKHGTKSIAANSLISDFPPEAPTKTIQPTANVASNGDQQNSAAIAGGGLGLSVWLFFGGGFVLMILSGSGLGLALNYLSDKFGLNLRPFHNLHFGNSAATVNPRFVALVSFYLIFQSFFSQGGVSLVSNTSAQYHKGYDAGRSYGRLLVPEYRRLGLTLDEEHVVEEVRSYPFYLREDPREDPEDQRFRDGFKDGYRSAIGRLDSSE